MSLIPLGFWAASGGGAGGSYELIESNILTSSASSVTFSSIPQDYKHLQIRAVGRGTAAITGSGNSNIQFNGDSSVIYASHRIIGDGSSVTSTANTGNSSMVIPDWVVGSSAAAGNFGAMVLDVLDYSSASKNTTIRAIQGNHSSETKIHLSSGAYFVTDAITSITFTVNSGDYASGSRFSLYGLRG